MSELHMRVVEHRMMSRPGARLALLGALALGTLPAPAHAAWIAGGNPISVHDGSVLNLTALPDESGGVFLVWTDYPTAPNTYSIYAARVLADGSLSPGWLVNGNQVSDFRIGVVGAAEDGLGNVLVLTQSGLDISPGQFGVNPDGTLRPALPGGPFTAAANSKLYRFVSDRAGGYYELTNSQNNPPTFTDSLFVGRVGPSGVFPGFGHAIGFSPNNRGYVQVELAPDPAGGVLTGDIVPVVSGSVTDQVGHVERTLGNGSLGFSDSLVPNGHDGTPTGHATMEQLSLTPDGSGGAFVAWRIGPPLGPALYMQHFLANGSPTWPTPTTAPVSNATFRDGAGGAFFLGVPLGTTRLELHRRAGAGSTPPGWAGGKVLSSAGPFSSFAGVRSGSHTYVCWSAGGGSADNIFAASFLDDGTPAPAYGASGITVCNSAGQQNGIVMLVGTGDDAYVAWLDQRAGGLPDVFLAHLTPSGPSVSAVPVGEPLAFSVGSVRPNPAQDFADFGLTLPDATPATVEILDLQGRVVAHTTTAGRSGVQRATLPVSGLENGLYFVRVRHGGHETSLRLSVFH